MAACCSVVLTLATPPAYAQSTSAYSGVRTPMRQEVLDQMLAPIALYPDNLLGHVLMAATRPDEVFAAARFVASNPELKGDTLEQALQRQAWSPSVQAVAMVPSVLQMMDEHRDWVVQLGEAFSSQERQVMSTVQALRQRAYAQGNLQSNEQQTVVTQPQYIAIEPAASNVVYVPYYNPNVVYGAWWWPAFPPFYWAPAYVYRPPHYGRLIATGVVFGGGFWVAQRLYYGWRPYWQERRWASAPRYVAPYAPVLRPAPIVPAPVVLAPRAAPPAVAAPRPLPAAPVRSAPVVEHRGDYRIEPREVRREERREERREARREVRQETRPEVRTETRRNDVRPPVRVETRPVPHTVKTPPPSVVAPPPTPVRREAPVRNTTSHNGNHNANGGGHQGGGHRQ